jgi:thioredoxin reductase
MSHTMKEAQGRDKVEGATIIEVDETWKPIPGTEKQYDVDTICIAVGLNPMTQLLRMSGCAMVFEPGLGGKVPAHDLNQETSVPGIFVAGDASGIEEASTAIIEGRIAGLAIANKLGYLNNDDFLAKREKQLQSMTGLRSGGHGDMRGKAKERLNQAIKG